jgi:hypothetical protein
MSFARIFHHRHARKSNKRCPGCRKSASFSGIPFGFPSHSTQRKLLHIPNESAVSSKTKQRC